jgi:spermidine/putrescine-binding protein
MKRLLALAVGLIGCSPSGPELKILMPSNYFAKDTLAAFERETGCRVKVDPMENSETLRTKLEGGASGYDLVVPSDEVVARLAADGLLEKLDLSKIPNAANLAPRFRGLAYDPKNEVSLPYMTGTTGLAYRTDRVRPAPDSWAAALRGKASLLDDGREVFAAAIRADGGAWTREGFAKAAARFKSWKPLTWDSDPKGVLINGDVDIAQAYSGDALQAGEALAGRLGFVIPKEGATLWVDNLCIARGTSRKELAHRFIDYLLRPDVSAAITNERRFGNPNEAARKLIRKELLENPLVFPTEEDQKRLSLLPTLSPDLKSALDQAWAGIKAQ